MGRDEKGRGEGGGWKEMKRRAGGKRGKER